MSRSRSRRVGYLRVNHDLLESLLRLPKGAIDRVEDGGVNSALVYLEHPSLPEVGPHTRLVPAVGHLTLVTLPAAPAIDSVALIDAETERELVRQQL